MSDYCTKHEDWGHSKDCRPEPSAIRVKSANILDAEIFETEDKISRNLEAVEVVRDRIAGHLESIEEHKIEIQVLKGQLLESKQTLKGLKEEKRILKVRFL